MASALRSVLLLLLPSMLHANGISAGNCRAEGGGFNETVMYLNKRPVGSESATCNDGSAAQMYFRPCCDGGTLGDFCNGSSAVWMIVFGDGNQDGWCWDEDSCAQRMKEQPELTGSAGLADVWTRFGAGPVSKDSGAFSKGGETNQNFYKSYVAYVPYCSSDLFLGDCEAEDKSNSARFCGKSIAMAAVRNLLPEMEKYGADTIFLSGGAGVMTYLADLKALLPSTAEVQAVCDGCVLLDASSEFANCSASDAFSCVPGATLPAATELWGAELPSPGGWRSLLSTGTAGATSLAAAQLPLLAQHPLYDDRVFRSRGASSAAEAGSTVQEAVRTEVLAALAPALVKVASACAEPQSSFTFPEMFSVTYGAGLPPPSYSTGLLALSSGDKRNFVDSCDGLNCNPSCNLTASVGPLFFA